MPAWLFPITMRRFAAQKSQSGKGGAARKGVSRVQDTIIERTNMANTTANYGNDSIRQLKDEERVRLRPAVIFGSDGLDGCAHAAFEILSNSVDAARQGHGNLITLTAFADGSIQVEDNGRGCPRGLEPH